MRAARIWPIPIVTLVLLLTWLLARGLNPDNGRYTALAGSLRNLDRGEVAMQLNALRARVGLLRAYDPLVASMDDARQGAADLVRLTPDGSALRQRANDLASVLDMQERLLEGFKSSNALMETSSAFFDQLIAQVASDKQDTPLAMAAGTLGAAMLQLTHDPSPDVGARVAGSLTALSALADEAEDCPQKSDAAALVQHGRMLGGLVTDVDASLRTLLAASIQPAQAAFMAQMDDDLAALERRAARYRVALYVVALLLVITLAWLAGRLRTRAQALRHRRDTERLVARLSARLIDCAPEETSRILGEAVGLLGPAFQADRCYLVQPDDLAGCREWYDTGVQKHPGWPASAMALLDGERGIDVVAVAALPPGARRRSLEAAGVHRWAVVPFHLGDSFIGLLGFDRLAADGSWPPGGTGLLALATEVIAGALRRQRVLQERADLELRLSRARRLEAVGTFASGIAHNFNNVIGAIIGHAEMAGEGLQEGGPRAWHMDEIRRASERARDLVAHILDYGSRDSRGRTPIEVGTLLDETLSLLRPSTPMDICLRKAAGPGRFDVAGEAGQLQQVFVNLIRNAAQASSGNGPILVEVATVTATARTQLSHGEIGPGTFIRAAVTDTGVGMDLATQRRLFQPFFTTRPAGTGLGLATAWEIVRDHDGALDVHSQPDHGSTFHVWLPALRPGGAGKPAPAGGGLVVMVLNPDATSRHRDEDVLAALGYEPVGFGQVDAALSACERQPDQFAAVVVDHAALSGPWQAARYLPAFTRQRCPVIMISPESPEDYGHDVANADVAAVVARPLRPSALAAALARHV